MNKFSKKRNQEFWNSFAKTSKTNPFGAHSDLHLVELENRFIKSVLKPMKIKSLIDVGCGNGQRTLYFSQFVKNRVLGIDYSQKMINFAKQTLSHSSSRVKKKVEFSCSDIHDFNSNEIFDVVVCCRNFVNQTNAKNQIKLFKILHKKLRSGGSLIIAESSLEGIKRLNSIRSEFGLDGIKIPWYNVPISETKVISKINNLFKIKKINRLGTFYYISRVIHPSLVYPKNPKPGSKINELALKAEIVSQKEFIKNDNPFERFGLHLLVHFKKI